MFMTYEGLAGEHISQSAKNSIELAKKYKRKVRMRFNDISLIVNKRLSIKHVVGTWQHMVDSRQLRYKNSPAYRENKARQEAQTAEIQSQLDLLMLNLPTTKEDSATWIAK